MPKSHYDYNVYTPELVAELKELVAGVPRAEGVKRLMKRLDISDRNARRQYVRYVEAVLPNAAQDALRQAAKIFGGAEPKSNIERGRPVRRLLLDIETSPNIGLFWRAGFKLNIGPENIIKERAIICAAYKWSDDAKVHVLTWDTEQDDKSLLAALIPVIAQADEIIYHNGDRFDMPWIRTRSLYHGLPPIPDVRGVDTLKWARSKFYFNSNKLDYIAKFMGIGGKIKTEFGLWKDVVLKKDATALKKMADYCRYDVVLLEKVWARLAALMPAKTHAGVLSGGDKWQCPRTGSTDVKLSKTLVTAAGTVKYQMQSKSTGSYYSISQTAYDAYRAAKGR
jgi:hypothetical protein